MSYQTANLVLNLIALGIQREAVHARLKEAEASGVPDSEVPALLKKWRDDAIAEAEKAGH